jgi:hypothetical protein
MKSFVRSALILSSALLIPLMPTAAHADRYLQNDAVGDVVSADNESQTMTPVPDQTQGDIAWSKIRHRSRTVILTMRYRELNAGTEALHFYAIRTSKMRRYVYLNASAGHWGGQVEIRNSQFKKVRCHVTRKIDYTANTATVWVPRSCLGRPGWVKVAMAEATFDTSNPDALMIDDARTKGNFNNPAWSPRVYR